MLTSSGDDKDVDQRDLDQEAKCALLANFLVSSGAKGKVRINYFAIKQI